MTCHQLSKLSNAQDEDQSPKSAEQVGVFVVRGWVVAAGCAAGCFVIDENDR